ncbi:MAG: hypothetical protein GC155_06815 [Alphaproteobacteria bacterium]|nr:hypothetical protein [Alphaproteobacteria bacterium]
MAGFSKLALLVGASLVVTVPAFGQTVHSALASVSPSPRTAQPNSASGSRKITNSWVCASGMRLEMLPVSFDDPTASKQFVVVYKQDGEVIASERIDAKTARNFPSYGCNDKDIARRSDLLG